MPKAAARKPNCRISPTDGLAPDDRPVAKDLRSLNYTMAAAKPLVSGGKRAVFGEGPIGAELAFVGEQPGDQEDLAGRPFVGPAGKLFDKALEAAGINRDETYVTNAVKHFKFAQRGKRRLHQKPTAGEVRHYRWWLMKELEFVQPHLVVALGATAALALCGTPVVIGRSRGAAQFGPLPGYITVHPSSLLRQPDPEARARAYADFVRDLKIARKIAAAH
jgi:DNA polymerase